MEKQNKKTQWEGLLEKGTTVNGVHCRNYDSIEEWNAAIREATAGNKSIEMIEAEQEELFKKRKTMASAIHHDWVGDLHKKQCAKPSIYDATASLVFKSDSRNTAQSPLLGHPYGAKPDRMRPLYAPEPNILEEAAKAVYSDRAAQYGPVKDNFGNIARLWSVITGKEITAEQVGLMMVALKVARQMNKPSRDNLVDGAGYFACLEKMEKEKENESK